MATREAPEKEEELLKVPGDLFQWNADTDKYYLLHEGVELSVARLPEPGFIYMLYVWVRGEAALGSEIQKNMHLEMYPATHSIVWSLVTPDDVQSFSVVLRHIEHEDPLYNLLGQCHWEASTGMPFKAVTPEDVAYVLKTLEVPSPPEDDEYEDVDLLQFEHLHIDEEENPQERRRRERAEEEAEAALWQPEEVEDEEDEPTLSYKGRKEYNRMVVDSACHQKSFVLRSDNIDVWNRADRMSLQGTIKSLKTAGGAPLIPSRIMLHEGETKALVISQQDSKKIYAVDLQAEQVVNEWKSNQYSTVNVKTLLPCSKYASHTPDPMFGMLAANVCVAYDPRQQAAVVEPTDPKMIHAKNPGFTCCATTRGGELVIGDIKGNIRLLSGVPGMAKVGARGQHPKTAKTLLPGAGDPILGLDTTADGSWIVATCAEYLLLICTRMPEQPETGFSVRMGSDKPAPIKLSLTHADYQKVIRGTTFKFTAATFNTGAREVWILTSVGRWLITWNFHRVCRGHVKEYMMKRTSTSITSESFCAVAEDQHGADVGIVVAHPEHMTFERRVGGRPMGSRGPQLEQ